MFLCIAEVTVVDTIYQAEVPEVVEDLDADPPIAGAAAIPEVPEVSHREMSKAWCERNAGRVAAILAGSPDVSAYEITVDASMVPTLSPVMEAPGGRKPAPPRDMVEIVNAAGNVIGSHIFE